MLLNTHSASWTTHIQYRHIVSLPQTHRTSIARCVQNFRSNVKLMDVSLVRILFYFILFFSVRKRKVRVFNKSCLWKLASLNCILLPWHFSGRIQLSCISLRIYEDVSYDWAPEISLTTCCIDCRWHFISWVLNLVPGRKAVLWQVVLQQKTTISCYLTFQSLSSQKKYGGYHLIFSLCMDMRTL